MSLFDIDRYNRSLEGPRLEVMMEFVQHGVRSMIAEGQNPHEVYHKAIPVFGENFLVEAGVVGIVNGEGSNNG